MPSPSRRRILDAAAAVFYERGFHGAGIDELGARAGISGPAIYRHFSGKDEVLATLFDEAIDELLGAAGQTSADPHADLVRVIRHHVRFAVTERHLVNVYQREDRALVEPWRRRFGRRRRQLVARWEDLVRRCYPTAGAGQVSIGTQASLGLIFSIAFWPPALARADEVADTVVGYVLAGLDGISER